MKNGEIKADSMGGLWRFDSSKRHAPALLFDIRQRKKNQYLWRVRCVGISRGGAGYYDILHPVLTGESDDHPPVSRHQTRTLPIAFLGDIRRGGGILRYPSPSTDRGVGRPRAGIFQKKKTFYFLFRRGAGILRYPSAGADRGVLRSPAEKKKPAEGYRNIPAPRRNKK